MDIVFPDTQLMRSSPTLLDDSRQLRSLLQQTQQRALHLEREAIASFTLSFPLYDPLHVFNAYRSLRGERFLWMRPAENKALVGLGSINALETQSILGVSRAARSWRSLQKQIVVDRAKDVTPAISDGPILFGGFAFDPLSRHTDLWKNFPNGLLVLPRLLLQRDEHRATLTVNTPVQPNADIELLMTELTNSLQQLQTALAETPLPSLETTEEQQLVIHNLLAAEEWKQLVRDAVGMLQSEELAKVVLARAVQVINEQREFDPLTVLSRLRHNYPAARIFALQRGERFFLGATPEPLIYGADGEIGTVALAGSAPRGKDETGDQHLGEELLRSAKNQGEHRVVVTTIERALTALCSHVSVAETPRLLKLRNIQHLETPITGTLLPEYSLLDVLAELHPTPAVGGYPRERALALIRDNERLDRGWYAGPIGWIGMHNDGEFAVALRSALLEGQKATLFAGCGIVADSDPESEYTESCLKLQVMLQSLRGDG